MYEATLPPDSGDFVGDRVNIALALLALLLITTLIGTNVGSRRRYIAALVDRAERLERERDQQAEIAAAGERERIAREMHDVIAHSLSVMIALSEGAHATSSVDPERSRDAIARVAETGRRTLSEVRRLLGSVRAVGTIADTTPRERGVAAPAPGARELAPLAEEFRRAGLPVGLTLTGEAPPDPALGLTVYRIVQESLTNALRHAAGATCVAARVAWHPDRVEIDVADDGDAGARPGEALPGRGIVGIRERAGLYGGSVSAGPRAGDGWRVSVVLPIAGEESER
jgi:signal transduction histidine kinase